MCQLFGQTIVLQIAVAVVRITVAAAADVVVYLAPQHGKANDTHTVASVACWVECVGNEALAAV